MRKTIVRKKRFIEHTQLDKFTGLILVSSLLPKPTSIKKEYKINITNLYFYKNNFCLLDKYIPENKILNFTKKYLNLSKGILSINKIYYKENKVIYLIYLDYDVCIKNFTKFITINMYKSCELEKSFNKDLYQAIYNHHKKTDICNLKIYYDKENYVETNICTIFYYLIGNEYIKKI